jgi:hypothetical protein
MRQISWHPNGKFIAIPSLKGVTVIERDSWAIAFAFSKDGHEHVRIEQIVIVASILVTHSFGTLLFSFSKPLAGRYAVLVVSQWRILGIRQVRIAPLLLAFRL